MKFTKKTVIHQDVDRELFIDIDNLNKELMDQPLRFRKWAGLEAESFKNLKTLESALEVAEAEAYINAKRSKEKLTVKELDSIVNLDEKVQSLKQSVIEAEALHLDMKGAVKACYQRHEALKDLSANRRKELLD